MSKTLDIIEKDLSEAKDALANEQGREAEVYSRIVGYYRSVRNWNKGKREEYGERKTFEVSKEESAKKAAVSFSASSAGDGMTGSLSFNAEARAPSVEEVNGIPVCKDDVCGIAPADNALSCHDGVCELPRAAGGALFKETEDHGKQDEAKILLFVQPGCPACPAAEDEAGEIARSCHVVMETVDAATEAGLAEAMKRNVVATPTAILLDRRGKELSRANDSSGIAEMRDLLEKVA